MARYISHPDDPVGMVFLFYFEAMNHICLNGKIQPGGEPALLAANRGYRYGDGLFETMKLAGGDIVLEQYHFERLFAGLSLLRYDIPRLFTPEKIHEKIEHLSKKNECSTLARIRLSAFRGNGGLYEEDRELQYLIECQPLNESVNKLNENGLVIDVYPDARKSCDIFSGLKSANFLPYAMAASYAREQKLNDCLLLNTHERICDSTIANLFVIKGEEVSTPALSEGCVSGIMRRYLLEKLKAESSKWEVEETAISIEELLQADEVFLTNAVNGIRWVGQFRDKTYSNLHTTEIYDQLVKIILP